MANTIRIKRRAAGGGAGAPASLENAELAYNEQTDILYYGKGTGGTGGSATIAEPVGGAGAMVTLGTTQTVSGQKDFTVSPTAPTPTTGDSTTKVATTAFVAAAITGGSIADGDKGDITVSGGGATWTIDAGVITNAKLADVATATIKGRNTAGTGPVQDLTVAQTKTMLALDNVDNTSDANKPVSTAVQNALNLKVNSSLLGVANGVATLDTDGKLLAAQVPAIAISDTFVVASQAAMLALSTAETGDIAIRTDLNKSFILTTSPPSTLANWQELLTPTSPVTSVLGRVGAVVAASGDYTVAQVTGAAPLASPALTGTPTAPTAAAATNTTQIATTAFVKAQGYSTTTGTVTSVAADNTTGLTWTGSPITSSGTLVPTLASNLQKLSVNTWTPEIIGKDFNLAGTDATEISLGVKNDGGGTAVFHYYLKLPSGLPPVGAILGGAGSRPWDGTNWAAHSTAAYHLVASENHTPSATGTNFRVVATPIGTTQANRIINTDFNGDGDIINSLGITQRKINTTERTRGLEIVRTNNACEISMVSDLNTSTYQTLFRGYSIGGTIASPAATTINMGTGYALCGHDGTSYVGAKALVSLLTFANWSNTSTPTTIALETTASGSTARTMRWFVKDTGHFYPAADNAYDMGTPTFRVRQYYGVNTSISTSDARLKTAPRDMTKAEMGAFLEIGRLPMVWQWLSRVDEEGDTARLHSGPTVQAAISVMIKYGLEWQKYAAYCYDEWDDIPEVLNEDSDVSSPFVPAGSRYSFRKEELSWWVTRALLARQDELETRLLALENR